MRKIAAVSTFLVVSVLHAFAGKSDIQGFSPGAPKAEVEKIATDKGCSISLCKLEGGTITLVYSKSGGFLKSVGFKFVSGTAPAAMIDQVTKQFGVKPTKANHTAEINYALGHIMDVPLLGRSLVVGGVIAHWKLSSDLKLQLDLDKPDQVNEYSLWLTSQKIIASEDAAAKKAREDKAAKHRAVNPSPKF